MLSGTVMTMPSDASIIAVLILSSYGQFPQTVNPSVPGMAPLGVHGVNSGARYIYNIITEVESQYPSRSYLKIQKYEMCRIYVESTPDTWDGMSSTSVLTCI